MLVIFCAMCCGQLNVCNYKMSIKMDRLVFVNVIEGCTLGESLKSESSPATSSATTPKKRQMHTMLSLSHTKFSFSTNVYDSPIVYKSRLMISFDISKYISESLSLLLLLSGIYIHIPLHLARMTITMLLTSRKKLREVQTRLRGGEVSERGGKVNNNVDNYISVSNRLTPHDVCVSAKLATLNTLAIISMKLAI